MNKKEFYEAPEWGLRTVRVERQYLQSASEIDPNGTEPSEVSDPYGG